MNRVLFVVGFASFASSLFQRLTDPLVPQIAAEFATDPRWVALLGSAFALPWALMQPILGPLGDLLGKTRVITACLCVLVASAVIGAAATTFPQLVLSRVVAGAAAGGVFPISMALYGDLVPVGERQVAMGRLLTAMISGLLLGSTVSGVLADVMPWRGIFLVFGAVTAGAAIAAVIALRGTVLQTSRGLRFAAILGNYRQVLSNPRTKICYGAVFAEGVILVGLFPFVAVLLLSIGEPRSSIAGLVLAGFALGGLVYALVVGQLVPRFSNRTLMYAGAAMATAGLLAEALVPPWPVQFAAMAVMGFGFYLFHSCILVQMTELVPEARGTAVAGHALSYFLGQALGPVVYAVGFSTVGAVPTILTGAVAMALTGYLTERWLRAGQPRAA
jgi:predicted MFS family arabinose efflux permease